MSVENGVSFVTSGTFVGAIIWAPSSDWATTPEPSGGGTRWLCQDPPLR